MDSTSPPTALAQGFADLGMQVIGSTVQEARCHPDRVPSCSCIIAMLLDVPIPLRGQGSMVIAFILESHAVLGISELAASEQSSIRSIDIVVEGDRGEPPPPELQAQMGLGCGRAMRRDQRQHAQQFGTPSATPHRSSARQLLEGGMRWPFQGLGAGDPGPPITPSPRAIPSSQGSRGASMHQVDTASATGRPRRIVARAKPSLMRKPRTPARREALAGEKQATSRSPLLLGGTGSSQITAVVYPQKKCPGGRYGASIAALRSCSARQSPAGWSGPTPRTGSVDLRK